MGKLRPTKWVPWALPGVVLPLLAAYGISTNSLTEDVRSRAGQALSANEETAWAKLESTGRDFVVQGTAPSQEALDAAVKTVAGTYGVRTVANTVQIVEPVKMSAPTVESLTVTSATPEIKGTWNEGVATTLSVGLGGTTYKLGESPELTTLAGNWLLKIANPLAEGSYDVTVETSDGKETITAAAPGKLVVDLPDPPPEVALALPTVESYLGNLTTPTIKGTWPEVAAKAAEKNLQVKLGETLFVLGQNPELTSDGSGNWTLLPTLPLLEGELEVMPGLVGADGKWIKAAAPGKVTVDVTPPGVAEVISSSPKDKLPVVISGDWPEKDGNSLSATLAGKTYKLGTDAALTSDGKGNFTFAPTAELAPGSYDVDINVMDAAGNIAGQKLSAAIVVPEPVKIEPLKPAETQAPAPDAKWPYTITGTWDERPGNSLSASVAGRTYVLGRGAALTSDGAGKFSFAPVAKFAPGTYDVDITTTDAAGATQVATVKGAIVIPEPPKVVEPAKPAVVEAPAAGATWPYAITGTWDERPGNSLSASVAGRTYALGRGAALTSDGAGKFSFAPVAKFAPGTYDVDITTTDAAGATQVATVKGAIVIPEPPKVIEPAKPAMVEAPAAGATWPYAITGTWDERPGNSLSASVAGRTYVLGRGAALTSDGAGKFSFAPVAKFAPGTYDLDITTTDAAGATQVATVKGAVVIPEPPKVVEPAKPAVVEAPAAGATWPYAITGTWDERPGNSLSASVAGRSYVLGRGAALTSDGAGKFSFAPVAKFAPGTYDVDITTTDASGAKQVATAKGAIVIPEPVAPTPPPPAKKVVIIPAPTINAMADVTGAPILTGTWPNQLATILSVTLNDRTYTLGQDANLNAKDGNWTLLPGSALANGTYDVVAEAADADGNMGKDTSSNELVVNVPPPPPPPPPKASDPPYDCLAVMTRIGNVFPIRFEFDRTDITKPFDTSVGQYAALLNDPRCTSITVQIEGHADFRGTEIYNMGLSERRADVIRTMLENVGVKSERMTISAMGESVPLDPAETDDARMKNRRVQITAKP